MSFHNQAENLCSNSKQFGENGETEYPFSLQDICLNYICNNLADICVTKTLVVSPKRRRVLSGSSSYDIQDDSGSCHSPTCSTSYQNSPTSDGNDSSVDGMNSGVLVSQNVNPILPGFSEEYLDEVQKYVPSNNRCKKRYNASAEDEKFRLSCPISINGQIDEDVKAGEFHIDQVKHVMRFPPRGGSIDDTIYLHTELSERLLERLCQINSEVHPMSDFTMSLFSSDATRLRSARLTNATKLTVEGLRTLQGHKIVELEIRGLTKANITDVIDECLGQWSIENMKVLNVPNCVLMAPNKYTTMVLQLTKLKSLTSLNVSGTSFNATSLEMVVEDLCNLENLDISCTKVGDITCLKKVQSRLKNLSLYGLNLSPNPDAVDQTIKVLTEMRELRHLDISDEKEMHHPFDMLNSNQRKIPVLPFLKRGEFKLPFLTSLDLSGKEDLRSEEIGVIGCLKDFIDAHQHLKFLGLSLTNVCKADLFGTKRSLSETCPLGYERYCPPNLIISGSGDETQILESLRRYGNRPTFVQKTFYHLFQLTKGYGLPRIDIIELVIQSAMKYPTVFGIQMAATACLFNLSEGETGQKLHPKILSDIVKVDLDAMEAFPQHQQLQKNVLLTLCNDRILQEVNFDKYRCAQLVMDCLCAWPDASMNRMSVAICSILAAKITTRETSRLGSRSNYMNKLLQIVRTKTDAKDLDITLRFTLSALWNLTDESPNTCRVFLDEGGMDLFVGVLQTFPNQMAIETKVLGLLNNIAEVKELRSNIMESRFIQELRKLMKSKHIEVSYFAAGIVAHLASNSLESWNLTTVPKEEITNELSSIVSSWETPENEMVAYRSFTPFFPLMAEKQEYAVQLWAVWAVHHVCSKNAKRYCPMLVYEEGIRCVLTLIEAKVEGTVFRLCQEILNIVVKESFMSESALTALRREVNNDRNTKIHKTNNVNSENDLSKSSLQ